MWRDCSIATNIPHPPEVVDWIALWPDLRLSITVALCSYPTTLCVTFVVVRLQGVYHSCITGDDRQSAAWEAPPRNSIAVVYVDRWWLRVYLELAPVGTLATASIIAIVAGAWPPWDNRQDLEFFAVLVTLGLACYGAVIWISELVGAAVLKAWSEYQTWKKNRQKLFLRNLSESGALNLDALTSEQLRKLGLEEADLNELRDKELAQR